MTQRDEVVARAAIAMMHVCQSGDEARDLARRVVLTAQSLADALGLEASAPPAPAPAEPPAEPAQPAPASPEPAPAVEASKSDAPPAPAADAPAV